MKSSRFIYPSAFWMSYLHDEKLELFSFSVQSLIGGAESETPEVGFGDEDIEASLGKLSTGKRLLETRMVEPVSCEWYDEAGDCDEDELSSCSVEEPALGWLVGSGVGSGVKGLKSPGGLEGSATVRALFYKSSDPQGVAYRSSSAQSAGLIT